MERDVTHLHRVVYCEVENPDIRPPKRSAWSARAPDGHVPVKDF